MQAGTDQQQMVVGPQPAHRFEQYRNILLLGAASGEHQQVLVLGEAQRAAGVGLGALWLEGFQVHAQRLHLDLTDTAAVQLLRHHAAGAEDHIKAFVEAFYIGPGARIQKAADAMMNQSEQIGVVKTHRRHVQQSGRPLGRPGGRVRVAGFDHVRLQAGDDAAPQAQTQRETKARRQRQGHRRQGHEVAVEEHARAGHHHFVAGVPTSQQRLALAVNVGTHATAGLGVKKRGIKNSQAVLPFPLGAVPPLPTTLIIVNSG